MKKIYLLLIPLFAFLLTGCGSSNTEKLVCTMERTTQGVTIKMNYTLEHDGTYVSGVRFYEEYSLEDVLNILEYDSSNETNKNALSRIKTVKEQVEQTYTSLDQQYGGYTIDIKTTDNTIVADVKIDYTKMNLDQLIKDNPTLSSYVENGKMLLSKMKSQYDATGLECK